MSRVCVTHHRCDCTAERLAQLEAERDRYHAALATIRRDYGQVCAEYELCQHAACAASYGAWATADAALAGDGG